MNKNKTNDGFNENLLSELKKNSRMSYRKIAKKTGVSTTTIIERMKKLEQEGIIKKYTISVNYEKLGYDFMAVIQISIAQGHLIEVQKKISLLSGIIGVYDVTGKYDSIVIAMAKNRTEFNNLIKKISSTQNVERTNTSIVLNVIKNPMDF
ncbi:MAG: Lrp/AsnC family transcriptional regulator [Candidatus Paceibacterota bacterium]|jgi:DNA-binding Lrp family transcriptional regulator